MAIRYVQWVDALGAVMQNVNLNHLRPLNEIGNFSVTDLEVEVVTNQKVNDPQIDIQLSRPLTAGKVFFLWRHPAVMLRILIEFVVVFLVVTILLSYWIIWRKNIVLLQYEKKIPFAMLLAFLAVITIEIMQQAKLPAVASYHEVDDLLYQLQEDRFQADYVLLGNSVGRQLFKNTPYLQNEKFIMMATNQAVTMTGQYFIAKRYLQHNKIPRAFILLTYPYFGQLDQYLADNYIQRTFTNLSEIFEILHLKKDLVFTAKTFAYRLLPSFKYRLFLQKQLVNYTNAESYTGIPYGNKETNIANYSLLHILQSYMQKKNIPRHHFISMLSLLNDMQIPLFFLAPAMIENDMESYHEYRNICLGLFPEWQKKYPNFHYDNEARFLQAKYYIDGAHFNEAGLKIETQYLHEKIINIEKLIK